MLTAVADGVFVRQSEFCRSNAVVVVGDDGVLLVDPGVHAHELQALARELSELGLRVAAGFSTHPHWDHLLWHEMLGSAPRYGTSRCVATARLRRSDAQAKAARLAEGVRLDLLGEIIDVPMRTDCIAWNGPPARILEHQGHAPGHAALLVSGVLVAGDMLSDVEIPLLDLNGTADPIRDYLAALDMFHEIARDVRVVIPGHGAVGTADQLLNRIDQDRAYVTALNLAQERDDARIEPSAGYGSDWLPGEHQRQLLYAQQRAGLRPSD
ncbi:MBL fold metallo-hydrolase [Jatrophihabitans sp.]|uniref:MBL fold metallo-hydrolase n=1 Tax=Jatrophihabitans sp. TaxID=1932789 RepID=UPI002C9849EF|nr:MBL fold metallo-hydrolase [Jatrophihabitans sp.]